MQVNPEEPSETPLVPEAGDPERPMPSCPNCGWSNVRLSRTKNPLDLFLGMVSIQRFKCRSCGNYFRRWYRLDV